MVTHNSKSDLPLASRLYTRGEKKCNGLLALSPSLYSVVHSESETEMEKKSKIVEDQTYLLTC